MADHPSSQSKGVNLAGTVYLKEEIVGKDIYNDSVGWFVNSCSSRLQFCVAELRM